VYKRGKGERVGNIEFGYRLSADRVHIEPDPAEQAALAAIRRLRSGGHSLRAIAGVLNESVHRTRRGTQWRLESVVRAINQDVAKGQQRVAYLPDGFTRNYSEFHFSGLGVTRPSGSAGTSFADFYLSKRSYGGSARECHRVWD
jgi:hypothetical protein